MNAHERRSPSTGAGAASRCFARRRRPQPPCERTDVVGTGRGGVRGGAIGPRDTAGIPPLRPRRERAGVDVRRRPSRFRHCQPARRTLALLAPRFVAAARARRRARHLGHRGHLPQRVGPGARDGVHVLGACRHGAIGSEGVARRAGMVGRRLCRGPAARLVRMGAVADDAIASRDDRCARRLRFRDRDPDGRGRG